MKKKIVLFTLSIFSLLLIYPTVSFAKGKPTPSPTPTPSVQTICIDPGHGGSEPGATNEALTEAQISFKIALKLQALLETNSSYDTVMTRTSDQNPGNSERAEICNNAHADYLVSIHLNGSTNPDIDYTLGLYGKKNKDYAWAKKINSAMSTLSNADGNGSIINNGITNFASGTLLKANMPATIVETVFITSYAEYLLFTTSDARETEIAEAIYKGIVQ